MAQQTSPVPVASLPPPPPIPESGVVTTDQIQKYLDENKQLILAILDNQNLGKLTESAQYQAQLQRNLLFLAALADEQPQTKAIRAQMMPHGVMPQTPQVPLQTAQPIIEQQHQQPHNNPPVQAFVAQPITEQQHQQPHNNPPAQAFVAQPITEQPHQQPQNSSPQNNAPSQASVDQSTAAPNEEETVKETENDSTVLNKTSEQEEQKC